MADKPRKKIKKIKMVLLRQIRKRHFGSNIMTSGSVLGTFYYNTTYVVGAVPFPSAKYLDPEHVIFHVIELYISITSQSPTCIVNLIWS